MLSNPVFFQKIWTWVGHALLVTILERMTRIMCCFIICQEAVLQHECLNDQVPQAQVGWNGKSYSTDVREVQHGRSYPSSQNPQKTNELEFTTELKKKLCINFKYTYILAGKLLYLCMHVGKRGEGRKWWDEIWTVQPILSLLATGTNCCTTGPWCMGTHMCKP